MICRYCNTVYKNRVHLRWCKENPNLEQNRKRQSIVVAIGASERTTRAWAQGKMAHIKVNRTGHPHTEETKQKLRDKALASDHRRLVKSTRIYVKKDGSKVLLDSSWEELLAKRLDDLDIEWIRPGPVKWVDITGKQRNYFPDFYLTGFDIFLDPKNPEACKQQHEKINWLTNNMKNLVFLLSIEEIKQYSPGSSVD